MIVNNLTTNEVKTLQLNEGCETFVTDVRGKSVGHFHVIRMENGFRFVGPHGQSERLAMHIDRYTIREDAAVSILDTKYVGFVFSSVPPQPPSERLQYWNGVFGMDDLVGLHVRWLGASSWLLIAENDQVDQIISRLRERNIAIQTEKEFHHERIIAGYPWYGIDIDDSNLPQEVDRNAESISFTKGCYLGQETVARLDALGQVQRKLVQVELDGIMPTAGAILVSQGKQVIRLTSVTPFKDGKSVAIGFARRTHFEPGSMAMTPDETCVGKVM